MRFVEVSLVEPDKQVVALADAYFFPPFQLSLLPKSKGGPIIPAKLPPRRARLVVYNKKSNETSIWIVELSEVHAVTRGGHHRGKVISSHVVPDVQPSMVRRLSLLFFFNPFLYERCNCLEICLYLNGSLLQFIMSLFHLKSFMLSSLWIISLELRTLDLPANGNRRIYNLVVMFFCASVFMHN